MFGMKQNMSNQGQSGIDDWREYLPYYREKYLALIAFMAGLLAVMAFWPWPIPAHRLWRALFCLGIFGVCVLLSRRRLFIAAAALAVTALRGMIAFALSQNWIALAMAVAAGGLLWAMVQFRGQALEDLKFPERYTWKEMLADIAVFQAIVAILYFAGK